MSEISDTGSLYDEKVHIYAGLLGIGYSRDRKRPVEHPMVTLKFGPAISRGLKDHFRRFSREF